MMAGGFFEHMDFIINIYFIKFIFKKIFTNTLFFSQGLLFLFCFTGCMRAKTIPQNWIETTGTGGTQDEAEMDARLKMIEWALGSYASSESLTVNAQSRYRFIATYTSGYVQNFSVLNSEKNEKGIYVVNAKGQVNVAAVGDSFRERMRELGHPEVLVFINENTGEKKKNPNESLTAMKINAYLNSRGYKTKDISIYGRFITSTLRSRSAILNDSDFENNIIQKSLEENVEVLVLGDVNLVNSGPVSRGSPLNSYQGNFKLKIINAGNGDIIASISPETVIQPDVNDDAGYRGVIDKAMRTILPELDRQIENSYKSGGTHTVIFKGLTATEFTLAKIAPSLKEIRGINGVYEKGLLMNGNAVDVKCFLSVPELKNAIVYQSWRFGDYSVLTADFKGSRIFITLKKN